MGDRRKTLSLGTVVGLLAVVVLIPFLPLLLSWRWDWWEAWAYAVIFILGFVVSRVLAARRHPDLIAERARFAQHEHTKRWDRLLAPLVGFGYGLVPLVAGLDARWGGSAPFSRPAKILSLVALLAGYAWASYALLENRFFSGVVRIQSERGHHVVSSGPYHWMRHPGYAGALLAAVATPVFLDSRWAFLPAVLLTVILVVRTALEDRVLHDELAGYREYAERVRYRLLPGVW
ncbi:MAG: isoprenylcysteine carboxylmethyltransferase family protein [Phycisphaerae bacterium]|nr:isoprenylcysteine carboxylmethyltransferase family protein [Phycisphaerae bacterium]